MLRGCRFDVMEHPAKQSLALQEIALLADHRQGPAAARRAPETARGFRVAARELYWSVAPHLAMQGHQSHRKPRALQSIRARRVPPEWPLP